MRTLIIDDEEYVRLVLEQAIREEGCEVTAVTHGAAGIELGCDLHRSNASSPISECRASTAEPS